MYDFSSLTRASKIRPSHDIHGGKDAPAAGSLRGYKPKNEEDQSRLRVKPLDGKHHDAGQYLLHHRVLIYGYNWGHTHDIIHVVIYNIRNHLRQKSGTGISVFDQYSEHSEPSISICLSVAFIKEIQENPWSDVSNLERIKVHLGDLQKSSGNLTYLAAMNKPWVASSKTKNMLWNMDEHGR